MTNSGTSSRKPLMGHLAGLGWISHMGEPTATQAAAVLLKNPGLREATRELIGQKAGVDLSHVEYFAAEVIYEGQGRPDLVGHDGDGRPLLIVEMKFAAAMTTDQMLSYIHSQASRIDGGQTPVLAALVPEIRTGEAERAVGDALTSWTKETGDTGPATAVITWTQWLDAWTEATADSSGHDSLAADVHQFRGLCNTLAGLVVAPIDPITLLPEWQKRIDDLRSISQQTTREYTRLNGEPGVLPIGDEKAQGFLARRYIYRGVDQPDLHLAVGIATLFVEESGHPLWLRIYNWDADAFRTARSRVLNSRFGKQAREDFGHLWVPLLIPADITGDALIGTLVDQVQSIVSVLNGPRMSRAL